MPILAFFAALVLWCTAAPAAAQGPSQPRPQFITFSLDFLRTQPLHFGDWPVEQLVGREVSEAQREPYDYRSDDGATTVNVLEFKRPGRGFGATVYPFGLRSGPALGLRISREDVPVIRIAFDGPAAVQAYELTDAYGLDIGAGVYMSDRSAGWGLGSFAFVAGGAGVIRGAQREGRRLFAEGGGGLTIGPVGVQLAVKFALNTLDDPVEHRFYTVPVSIRTSVSF